MKLSGFTSYYTPTPALARKIGDSLLAASTAGSTFAIATSNNTIGMILMIVGTIGKFASNFFVEDPK